MLFFCLNHCVAIHAPMKNSECKGNNQNNPDTMLFFDFSFLNLSSTLTLLMRTD